MDGSSYIQVDGFGDPEVNGRYFYQGDRNGYPFYRKDENTIIRYHKEFGPYCFEPSYYIEKEYRLPGSVPIIAATYRVTGTDPTNPDWVSLVGTSTVESGIGATAAGELMSSSSNSSSSQSSSSSSSSSSEGVSESSSSSSSSSEGVSESSSSSSSSSEGFSESSSSSSSSSGGVVLWTPADIATVAWYDAADASTVTEIANKVSQWDDKSGNGNDATQGIDNNQPTISSFNSLTAIDFDGVSTIPNGDYFLLTSSFDFFDKTVFAVLKPDVTSGTDHIFGGQPFNNSIRLNSNNPTDHKPTIASAFNPWVSGGGAGAVYSSSNVLNNASLISWSGGTRAYITVNGGTPEDVSQQDRSGSSFSLDRIGTVLTGVPSFDGLMCEIIVTASVADTATRQKIEGYLAWKWGLEGNLPIGHPYKDNPPYA